jgi:hypothetical protein
MDPRMAAREWFLDQPGHNKYDIEVHVQRSFWHNGFGQAFFRCTKAEPPYKCVGFWRGQEVELEWTPRQWLTLSMQKFDASMVDGVSGVIRLEPSLRYTVEAAQNGQAGEAEEVAGTEARVVVEWRVRNVTQRLAELGRAGVRDVQQV